MGGQVANALTLLWLDGRHRRLPRLRDVLPAIARHLVAAAGLGVVGVPASTALFPVPLHTSVRSLAQLGAYALAAGARLPRRCSSLLGAAGVARGARVPAAEAGG